MIVGNGDIAQALKDGMCDRHEINFFASGVSNSQEIRELEYEREENLLLQQPKDMHIVYFSSLSIFYSHSRYALHKILMENLVKEKFPQYTIMRIGNINWGTNPHTIINHLRSCIHTGKPIEIRNEKRYILSMVEFWNWIDLIPEWNCEMNITGEMLTIKEIFKKYVL